MKAVFDDTLVTGNEMIDSQHKELIERINDLLIKAENGSAKVEAVKMLDHLADYTDYHLRLKSSFRKRSAIRESRSTR